MKMTRTLRIGALSVLALVALAAARVPVTQSAVQVGERDIGGVVRGARGPEAGVWVIAETTDLPTQVREHRRHRRSRTIPGARSAEGELQRLGARLRAGRFAEDQTRAGQDAESHGGRRAEPARRGRSTIRPATGCR